jgi:ABC-type sulfate transport system substrate-binding protein
MSWGRSLKKLISLFLTGIIVSVGIAARNCLGNSNLVEFTLVFYAVTRSAYEQIVPKFAAKWKAEHQQDVFFTQSDGGSGAQARAKARFRPVEQQVAPEFVAQFPKVDRLFTVQELEGWKTAKSKFFDTGAVFDQI